VLKSESQVFSSNPFPSLNHLQELARAAKGRVREGFECSRTLLAKAWSKISAQCNIWKRDGVMFTDHTPISCSLGHVGTSDAKQGCFRHFSMGNSIDFCVTTSELLTCRKLKQSYDGTPV
jgi:hypothetical protein